MTLTVVTVLPAVALLGLSSAYVVLAVSVSLSSARFDRRLGPGSWTRLLRVPVVVLSIALIGLLLRDVRPLGDVAVVATYGGALATRGLGPRVAAAGRAALLPLVAMFMTRVPADGSPLATTGLILLVCLVAGVWGLVVQNRLARRATRPGRLARAATSARPRPRDVLAAATALDDALPPAHPARLDVVRVQVEVDAGRDPRPALAELASALGQPAPDLPPAEPDPDGEPAPAGGVRRPSRRAMTSLALQGTLALTLGLLVGQLLFPAHWSWTVVTVLTLTVGARARGDVVLRGLQRLAGAAAGTALSTVVAGALAGHRVLAVAVLLVVLGLGVLLRDVGYAYWALCLTTVLGLLYGLLGQESGPSVLLLRLLAVLAGFCCAVLPAWLLRPIRSRALARRRAADWLGAVRGFLAEPSVSGLRAVESAAVRLDDAVPPLRLAARLRRRSGAEPQWADTASAALPATRRIALGDDDPAPVRTAYATVGRSLKAAVEATRA